MNLNIANELKTGPRTEEGKEITRLNALKDGKYSKLLRQLNCNQCKRKGYCNNFKEGSNCTIRGEITKTILTENLDIYQESKELYTLALTNALESMMFNKKDSCEKLEYAGKMLDRIVKILPGLESEKKKIELHDYLTIKD